MATEPPFLTPVDTDAISAMLSALRAYQTTVPPTIGKRIRDLNLSEEELEKHPEFFCIISKDIMERPVRYKSECDNEGNPLKGNEGHVYDLSSISRYNFRQSIDGVQTNPLTREQVDVVAVCEARDITAKMTAFYDLYTVGASRPRPKP